MKDQFYRDTVADLIGRGDLDSSMRVLVVCGGQTDRDVLYESGFRDVVISNVGGEVNQAQVAPFAWSRQDAEQLGFESNSFDFSVVHAGLHHCRSPHRALLEMYRVARKGVLLIEPCDNRLTRLGVHLGFGQEYEHAAVYYNNCAAGGVRNTEIPNYVYRWTQRDIVKTVNSFAPEGRHGFRFVYGMSVPWQQLRGRRNPVRFVSVLLLLPLLKALAGICPKQS